jgi:hypothetical protein
VKLQDVVAPPSLWKIGAGHGYSLPSSFEAEKLANLTRLEKD